MRNSKKNEINLIDMIFKNICTMSDQTDLSYRYYLFD